MVRSKGERSPPRDLSHLADKFRQTSKHFDISLAEIERRLDENGATELVTEVEVEDDDGEPVAAEIRLNLNCVSEKWTSWTFSVKLHRRVCIDRIDHEFSFPMGPGKRGSGWHRHTWDKRACNCENHESGKQPLETLARLRSRTALLRAVFIELGITWNRNDDGTGDLPID
jgi:hypothetical protein